MALTASPPVVDTALIKRLEAQALVIRRDIVKMVYTAQAGHPGGSLSSADIMTALYFHVLRLDPKNPAWPERDRFILSKGHSCPALYACLARRGFYPLDQIYTLRQLGSMLQGHPHRGSPPGVETTSGSLGNGFAVGMGMALALRMKGSASRVYVLLGDGELDEGLCWEAAMASGKYKLDNLTAIVDRNRLQNDGSADEIMPLDPLPDKWRAFRWRTIEINGHDMPSILAALDEAKATSGQPTVIIANTVKGKGVSYMENNGDWHGKWPNQAEYEQAVVELGAELGVA